MAAGSVHTHLTVLLSVRQKYVVSAISTAVLCTFTPMCPCRAIWSCRQHPVHEGRLLCAALCFQPVHERNCNYGTQPPPLTHANMHYNWPIHTGKCLLNGLPIFSRQPTITYEWIFLRNCIRLYHRPGWFEIAFSLIRHQKVFIYIRPVINGHILYQYIHSFNLR